MKTVQLLLAGLFAAALTPLAEGVTYFHCSARVIVGTGRANEVFLVDGGGTYTGMSYDQVPGAYEASWGYRDGMSDHSCHVYFGWEEGVARHPATGGPGVMQIVGPAPSGVGVWRALAYDPTGDGGNGSIWCASFGSNLIETTMYGVLLNTYPSPGSLYGLAYDDSDGNLWGHDTGGAVIKIDTTTGGVIPGAGWANGFPNLAAQGGLSSFDHIPGHVAAISQGTPDELGVYDSATGTLIGGPWDVEIQTGSNGHLGVAVVDVDEYFITLDDLANPVEWGGSGFQGEWFFYPNYIWWNMWFYNGPDVWFHWKLFYFRFDYVQWMPGPLSDITVTLNWSTPDWPWPSPAPPLPPDVPTPVLEDLLIFRPPPFLDLIDVYLPEPETAFFYLIWPFYNPEWVSVDIRGRNIIMFRGLICHACLPWWGGPCCCDIDGNGVVNVVDLLALLAAWGPCPPPCPPSCPEDCNGDCVVNVLDLLQLLSCWGPCPGGPPIGACCYWPSGDCLDLFEVDCGFSGGTWMGPGTDCATTVCPTPPPGETIADAIPIPTLPYSTTGSTVPYQNDYDEVCPYTGSTAPDCVYAYTPAANETVNVTLCANSAYDSKLYIYENAHTPGAPHACNDDACSTPSFPSPYVSELLGVSLTAGNTYYIVIDGYSSASGNYTLDID